jgi:hypothetical protein
MKKIERVNVDFNNADKEGRVRLSTYGALKDIREKNIELRNGLELLLDDEDEFLIPGIVEFSEDEGIWVAKIDWNLLK